MNLLITGGTGSLGQALTRHFCTIPAVKTIGIYSRDELKQAEMKSLVPEDKVFFYIGDVRDVDRLTQVVQGGKFNAIIHSAALKRVDGIESNPSEAVKTNILGAMNVIQVALRFSIERVVALSTDKACAPVNLYGATKLCSDKLFLASNYNVVRYGNVFTSRGSVVPLWVEQNKAGKELTVTDLSMTRFSLSLKQGVALVESALWSNQRGLLFVAKTASYRLTDLINAISPTALVRIVGIRPGEKLHETLISQDEAHLTRDLNTHFLVYKPNVPMDNRLGRPVSHDFCYNSETNAKFLTVKELENMVEDYMAEQQH